MKPSGTTGEEVELPVILASPAEGRKTDSKQANRADAGLGALEKGLRHGRDLAGCRNGMGKGVTAGRGLRVRIAQLQNDATRGDALEAERALKAVGEVIELLAEDQEVGLGAPQRGLLGEASGIALPSHPAIALAAGKGVELKAAAVTERFGEDRGVDRSQLAHVPHAELGQTLLGVTADARKPCHGKSV